MKPAEKMQRLRDRKKNDQISVRGTINKRDKPIWDKINVDNEEVEKGKDDEQ
jgi:hypothetical protein